jgi:hypothetical protein
MHDKANSVEPESWHAVLLSQKPRHFSGPLIGDVEVISSLLRKLN